MDTNLTKINLKYRENEVVSEWHFSFQLSVQRANMDSPTIHTLKLVDRNGELFFSMDSNGFDVPELAKLISLFHRAGTDAVITVLRDMKNTESELVTVEDLVDAVHERFSVSTKKPRTEGRWLVL